MFDVAARVWWLRAGDGARFEAHRETVLRPAVPQGAAGASCRWMGSSSSLERGERSEALRLRAVCAQPVIVRLERVGVNARGNVVGGAWIGVLGPQPADLIGLVVDRDR